MGSPISGTMAKILKFPEWSTGKLYKLNTFGG
jgi:hypothetical protein